MNRKLKTLLVPAASITAVSAVFVSASCSGKTTSTDSFKTFSSQQIYGAVNNSKYSETAFYHDGSLSYGGMKSRYEENTYGQLLRKQNLLQSKVEVEQDPNDISKDVYKIVQPSIWRYKLELADAVILTDKQGQEHVFDNDSIDDEFENRVKNGETFELLSYQAKNAKTDEYSQKSINSTKFFELLGEGVQKIQLRIRKGVKWTNAQGQSTKYDLVADDFYVSWLRTNALGESYRAKTVSEADKTTFKDLEAQANSLLNEGSSYFTSGMSYPNEYLYKLYGFNSKDFSDKSKFIQKGENDTELLTFNALKTDNLATAMFEHLAENLDFVAAPSQYIKENMNDPKFEAYRNAENASKYINNIKALDNNNLLKQIGTYWYGVNDKYNLYVAPYYYAGYDEGSASQKYLLNEGYWDKTFTDKNNKTNIRQIVIRFKNDTEETQFQKQIWDDYLSGRIVALDLNSLTTANRNDAQKSPEKYGINYSKSANKISLQMELGNNLIPGILTNDPTSMQYSENLAQMLFGVNYKGLISRNGEDFNKPVDFDSWTKEKQDQYKAEMQSEFSKTKGVDFYKNALSGNYLSFRSIISSAVNWDYLATYIRSGNGKQWISGAPLYGAIGGSDDTSLSKRMNDYYTELNTLFTYDNKGNKVDGLLNNPETNINAYEAQAGDQDKIKSADYAKLQELMTKLIDEYVAAHPEVDISKENPLTIGFVYRWINYAPATWETIWSKKEFLSDLVSNLDTKGRLKAEFKKYDRESVIYLYNAFFTGFDSLSTAAGWSNDVDHIGSTLDGYLNGNGLGQLLPVIANEEIAKVLETSFPQMVKLSKEFVKYVNDPANGFTLSIPMDKFINIPSTQLIELRSNYQDYKFDDEKGILVKIDHETDTTEYTDFATLTASFLINYTSHLTNDQNIALYQEIVNFTRPTFDTVKYVSKENISKRLQNYNYSFPYPGNNNLYAADTTIPGNQK